MSRRSLFIGMIILAVIVVGGGIWLYDWVLGETQEASEQINAIPLEVSTTTPQSGDIATAAPVSEDAPIATPVVVEPPLSVEGQGAEGSSSLGLVIYRIVQEESQVRFNIYEELRGAPKDVIGTSTQIAGEVGVDLDDLSTAQVGVIQINARTLVTDDDRRNQAIRNRILNTDQYEYITFTPVEIIGLSGGAQPGQPYTFQIAGDLTVRDVTQPVIFGVSVLVESADRLTGSASTGISRADFNLIVPDLPFIANVSDEVILEIDFILAAS